MTWTLDKTERLRVHDYVHGMATSNVFSYIFLIWLINFIYFGTTCVFLPFRSSSLLCSVVVYIKVYASLQFLKSKADLEYIEKRLKLDFINDIAENGSHAQAVTKSWLINTQLKTSFS